MTNAALEPERRRPLSVADSTPAHDRDVRRTLYARHDEPQLWLVDARGEGLIVRRVPGESGYAQEFVQPPGNDLDPVSFPDVTVDLSGLPGSA